MFECLNHLRDKMPKKIIGTVNVETKNSAKIDPYIFVEQDFWGRSTGIVVYLDMSGTSHFELASQELATRAVQALKEESRQLVKLR